MFTKLVKRGAISEPAHPALPRRFSNLQRLNESRLRLKQKRLHLLRADELLSRREHARAAGAAGSEEIEEEVGESGRSGGGEGGRRREENAGARGRQRVAKSDEVGGSSVRGRRARHSVENHRGRDGEERGTAASVDLGLDSSLVSEIRRDRGAGGSESEVGEELRARPTGRRREGEEGSGGLRRKGGW